MLQQYAVERFAPPELTQATADLNSLRQRREELTQQVPATMVMSQMARPTRAFVPSLVRLLRERGHEIVALARTQDLGRFNEFGHVESPEMFPAVPARNMPGKQFW